MLSTYYTKNRLTRDQKESICLLSIGTFLEYFDLMLYVHMAVLLNDLFFPKTDPYMSSILSAFAFCSTFVFRPFGGFIFGWIGDNIGRKPTVVLTTLLMSVSCVIMALIPTYSQIGIAATYAVTICRVLQGMASMGEAISAELYLTETVKPPMQYPAVALISVFIAIGMMAALGIASMVTSFGLNWRYAFWIGALIAIVGATARTRLRETPDFVDAKRIVKQAFDDINLDKKNLEKSLVWKEKVLLKTALSLFLIQCSWPACFYFVYFYCGNILKTSFGYSSSEIIQHNFMLSIVQLLSVLLLTYFSYYIVN
jgi:MHS family proline/betaine transporter-like MFS transporter